MTNNGLPYFSLGFFCVFIYKINDALDQGMSTFLSLPFTPAFFNFLGFFTDPLTVSAYSSNLSVVSSPSIEQDIFLRFALINLFLSH